MAALLDDALRCVSVDFPEQLWREAARWIFSDDRAYPFSFLNVCDAVDMDPEWLRHVARKGCGKAPRNFARSHRKRLSEATRKIATR